MLTIAGGIILAFIIMGLLEELPDKFWYWFWGAVIVFLIYQFGSAPDWGEIFNSFLAGIVLVGMIALAYALVRAPSWYIEHRRNKKADKKHK